MSTVLDIGTAQYYYSNKINAPAAEKEPDKLKEACIDFSSIFIKQMLNAMKKTVPKTGMMDGGMAEEIFEDMLYDEYAKSMAQTANLGLAEMMYEQLKGGKL